MIDKELILDIYLHPNEMYWGDGETRIKTVLGSCIAICMWHPGLKIGGMSHSLLPTRRNPEDKKIKADPRFVDEAVDLFSTEVSRVGLAPAEFKVKIFGGANLISTNREELTIGEQNREIAYTALGKHGFFVFSEHTGGTETRNVILDLWSGETWLRRITKQ
jgi:chemotaxis protein CheD